MKPRRQPLWIAAMVHRLSGLALVLFLPAHFYVLALSLQGEAALDRALAWTANPLVKLAEMVLVFLLAVHLFGGIRLLVLENFAWSGRQKTFAALAGGGALVVAFAFVLQVV